MTRLCCLLLVVSASQQPAWLEAYRPIADDFNGLRRVQLVVEHMGAD